MPDIASYEEEVLVTVERGLREAERSLHWPDPERQVRDVRLEGEYPNTKLVVVFDDPKWGKGLTEEFFIHQFKGPHGEPLAPEAISTIVWANVEEFGYGSWRDDVSPT